MEQNAVSVSLSPCARHLAVGLGSKRVSLVPYGQNGVMAIIFRLDQSKDKSKGLLCFCFIAWRCFFFIFIIVD